MYMLISNGVLYTILVLFLLKILMSYAIKINDNKMQNILMLFYFNAIVNNGIINYVMNPLIVALVPAIVLYYSKYTSIKEYSLNVYKLKKVR